MKIINDCLILNKDEVNGIIPILENEVEFNSMILEQQRLQIKKFEPGTIEHARNRLEVLMPFFIDYMEHTGKMEDTECKHLKKIGIDEFAHMMAERTMERLRKHPDHEG